MTSEKMLSKMSIGKSTEKKKPEIQESRVSVKRETHKEKTEVLRDAVMCVCVAETHNLTTH